MAYVGEKSERGATLMHILTIISAALVLVLSMIIRSVDTFRFYALGTDTFVNLLYSKWLRDGSPKLYKAGKTAYPPFLPWLLCHLQDRLSIRLLHLIPKLFDALTSITVFFFTLWLSGNDLIALLALLTYTFSPINVINGYGILTRNIGSFFFAFTVMASYVAMFNTQFKYILPVLAITSCILMMLTSRIAYKTYFILVTVAAILSALDNIFVMFLLLSVTSFALCILITRGKFIDDIKGQFFLINFIRLRRSKAESKIKRIALVFYNNLWWCTGILAVLNGADLFLTTWLCTVIALSFFWPWGEAPRHIALGSAPASILSALYLFGQPFMIIPLLLLEIAIICRFSIRVLQGRFLVSVDQNTLRLFKVVKELEDGSLFLCVPPVYNALVAYFAEKKVLYGEYSNQEGLLFQSEVLDAIKTQSGLEELASRYPVTHLFVDSNNFHFTMNCNRWEPVIQEEHFMVFKKKTNKKDSVKSRSIQSAEVLDPDKNVE